MIIKLKRSSNCDLFSNKPLFDVKHVNNTTLSGNPFTVCFFLLFHRDGFKTLQRTPLNVNGCVCSVPLRPHASRTANKSCEFNYRNSYLGHFYVKFIDSR